MEQRRVLEGQYLDMCQAAQLKGILRRTADGSQYFPYNIAFHPFETTQWFYQQAGYISTLWQKYCFLASQNKQLIKRIFEPLRSSDSWVDFLLTIYDSQDDLWKDSITYTRCDYFLNTNDNLPKLTEYNLMTVGMSFNMKQVVDTHRLCFPERKDDYFPSDSIDLLVATIANYYQKKEIKGLFLILIADIETTILEQKYIECHLRDQGIKCKRLKLQELIEHCHLNEDRNLYLRDELVSFAYFRTGYNLGMYTGNLAQVRKCRQMLAVSKAISIPSVNFELINLKRMQIELSKPFIIRQFLNEEEARSLETSLIESWDFDTMRDVDYDILVNIIKENKEDYVLKPNKEGGDNNIFGEQAFIKLLKFTKEQRKNYILQRIIPSPVYQNEIIYRGIEVIKKRCSYEMGRYGVICQINGQLILNESRGYLLRSRGEGQNEGMILAGTDGFVAWRRTTIQ